MNNRTGISRRSLLLATGAVTVGGLGMPFVARGAQRIVMPSYGGTYEASLRKNVLDPFTADTGIEVVVSGVPDLARLAAQVKTSSVEWDIFDSAGSWFAIGSQQGLFEPLAKQIFDNSNLSAKHADDYVLIFQYAMGPCWNTERAQGDAQPRTLVDFWNVEKFPGRRVVRNRIDLILEAALVADGVSVKELYPLDVERGFEALTKMKPHIAKWVDATTQLSTLLVNGEADYSLNWNNRVKVASEQGMPLGMSCDQTIIFNNYFAVPKGAPNKDAAMKLIEFSLQPKQQLALASENAFLPANSSVAGQLPESIKAFQPDLNTGNHVVQDDTWWVGKTESLQQRFLEFLLL